MGKVTRNEVTGDKIQSRPQSRAYSENYDAIFRKAPATSPVSESSTTEGSETGLPQDADSVGGSSVVGKGETP